MKSIEDHIEHDKKIADDPQANPAARRHAKEELHELEEYVEHHKEEIEAGDHHDPNALELFLRSTSRWTWVFNLWRLIRCLTHQLIL